MAEENVTIKVNFEADLESINKTLDELEDKVKNTDMGSEELIELTKEERKVNTEFNNLSLAMDRVGKRSSVLTEVENRIQQLGKAIAELRQNAADTSENAAAIQAITAQAEGLINQASLIAGVVAGATAAVKAIKSSIKDLVNNVKLASNTITSLARAAGSSLISIGNQVVESIKSKVTSIINTVKSLVNIDFRQLGYTAIGVANEFKNLGSTAQIVARQMSNAFYEAAGDSYESLVKLSNGTEKVTNTLLNFINSWTGQVALLKAQLTSIGANIGNLLMKVFYPLLVVLNKILAVVNALISKLASLFGFKTENLSSILGNVGGASSTQNKGLEDYTKSANKAAKATKKLSDNTKKAKDNLQGYDKLNNNTTDDLDDLIDKMDDLTADGLGDLGAGGIFDTDKLFNNLMDELDLIPDWLKKWIDELIALVKAGDWYGVGTHIGDLVNKGLKALDDFLSDDSLRDKLHKFNEAFLDFANGLLDTINWTLLGKTIASSLNLIAFEINDLYKTAVEKGTLIKIGKALHDAFFGFIKNVDAYEVGKSVTTLLRSIIDIVYTSLDTMTGLEAEKLAEQLFAFIDGAFDRLMGMEEGDLASGAEKIGTIIAKVINLGFKIIGKLVNKDTATKAADAIITILNTAIDGLNVNDMEAALSGLLNFISTLLTKLAEEVNIDEFVDKITETINNSIQNGDVEQFVASLVGFIKKIYDSVKKIIHDTDKSDLFKAIVDGINEGGGVELIIDWIKFSLAPKLLGALAIGIGAFAGSKWLLTNAFTKALGVVNLSGAGAEAGAVAAQGATGALEGATTAAETAGAVVGNVLGTVLQLAGTVIGVLGGLANFTDSLANGLNEDNAKATVLYSTLAGFSMGGPIGGIIGALIGGFSEIAVAFAQNTDQIREKTELLVTYLGLKIKELPQQILVTINTILDNIRLLFNRAMNLLGTLFPNASAFIKKAVNGIFDWIVNSINGRLTTFYKLGEFIVKAIANGISAGAGWVKDKVNEIVNNIKSTFTNGLQIHSPSKIMEDLAIFVPEGVAQGIEDGQGSIDDAMSDMINSMKFSDFYTDAYNQTDTFVDDVTARLQDITAPELDPLQYQANITRNPSQTASMIAQSYSESSAAKASSMMSGIYNRIVAGVGQTGGRNVIVDVYLDKNNKLGQYVIDTMKGNVVMTGGV